MQGRQRRLFTEEYKRHAVELAVASGDRSGGAKELGLLRRWVDELREELASAARRPTTQATPMSADQASHMGLF
ncbi:transposase [Bradyrhizobium sp. BRP22]|uniref:hypothetical protein n=1 Tax=Bradyrhizobium sp. BRP22 TaxID=2793821 RepID=UPI001CD1E488|nr:hypothetical protein [Bradyrhizobium sp. BRP22]MCA1458896.1 transposase [Bradyrhizobium sp. BRP22]